MEKLNVCLINDSFPPAIDGVANAVTNYAKIIARDYGYPTVVTPFSTTTAISKALRPAPTRPCTRSTWREVRLPPWSKHENTACTLVTVCSVKLNSCKRHTGYCWVGRA